MSVNLSLLGGAGWQFFTDNGTPLAGGLLYTYLAGTSTAATTYTTSAGNVPNSNPIVLNSAGRVQTEIWLTQGVSYKFVLKTSAFITIGTYDNIDGAADPADIYAALAASSGSSLVGFIQSGSGAVATTVQAKLRESVSVLDFGAVGDGVTDDTAAIQAAIDSLSINGGTLYFPVGTYSVSTIIWKSKVSAYGDGHFSSIILGNTSSTDTLILMSAISRVNIQTIQFNGNSKCNNTLKFIAPINTSCGSMWFSDVYLRGALVDTVLMADALDAGADDISHISFYQCYFRSDSPSNSQFKVAGANALSNNIYSGIMGGPGASPYNVHLVLGQLTAFGTYFQGADTCDIYARGGQWQSYAGRSESASIFISDALDTTGHTQAPHIIQGLQGSNSGALSIDHKAVRDLVLIANQFGQNVSIGGGSNDAICYAQANNFGAGKAFVLSTFGFLYGDRSSGNVVQQQTSSSAVNIAGMRYNAARVYLLNSGATPSVANGNVFRIQNDAPQTITNFLGGVETQEVILLFSDANTTIADTVPFRLTAAFSSALYSTLRLINDGTDWVELSRSST